jgi:hypothetical protein
MICQDSPNRSFSQPHCDGWPPPAISLAHSSSTSCWVSQETKNDTASVNVKCGPAFRPMNRCPSSSQVTDITWSPLRWTETTFERGKIDV